MLTNIAFTNFTAFERLDIALSPGINIFLGENGTGKTHVLKAGYAACDVSRGENGFAEKVTNVFYPSKKNIRRLVRRQTGNRGASLKVTRKSNGGKQRTLSLSILNHAGKPTEVKVSGAKNWAESPIETAYIPAKDVLANSPGFQSLYEYREIHFEDIYVDILRKAHLPPLRNVPDKKRAELLERLQAAMGGKIIVKNEEFFLKTKYGELEFTLLAEGYRKLGLLWLLIKNGVLPEGSVLFWDEPETNLNPIFMQMVVGILLELQRLGVQVILATHDYVTLKEFDMQCRPDDRLTYNTLYKSGEESRIECLSTETFHNISPNAIDDAYASIIDREIGDSMGELGK